MLLLYFVLPWHKQLYECQPIAGCFGGRGVRAWWWIAIRVDTDLSEDRKIATASDRRATMYRDRLWIRDKHICRVPVRSAVVSSPTHPSDRDHRLVPCFVLFWQPSLDVSGILSVALLTVA